KLSDDGHRLSWLSDKNGMVPVNWRAMETEELGSVYESLLELQPQLSDDGKTLLFASEAAEQKGNQRKTTGSYYTPDSLVQALLDTALDPVLDKTEPDKLLKLTVIDPACGSGHFLLAAARRIATRLARHRAEGTPALSDFRHALRDVARSCLHGVDRNPMAVELTKVALWIETVDPGLPLGFFDAQIRCGDSLFGVARYGMLRDGLPDAAFEALTGDEKDVAKEYRNINKEQREGIAASGFIASLKAPAEITDGAAKTLAMPEDTLDQIETKSRAWARLLREPKWWTLKTACDMYVAAFLMPKTGEIPNARVATMPIPTTEAIWRTVQGGDIRSDTQARCIDLSESAHAFHWPLEFPAQMASGGFDVVIGNPPWEVSQLSEEEFFAARDPSVAALDGNERKRAIKRLKTESPQLWKDFNLAKRSTEAVNTFFRASGRFPLTATGKINTYPLFAEHFAQLAHKSEGESTGHAGVIVPTGIATDSSTAAFFGDLVTHNHLLALYDFENREKFFPAVDSRVKFSILSIGPARTAKFAAFLLNTGMLTNEHRQISLTPDEFNLFNPNTNTAPLFRARADKELTRKLYQAAPVLIRERPDHPQGDENPWGITFQQGLYNMTSASSFFRTAAQLTAKGFLREGPDWRGPDGQHYLPLYEAKMIHHFDHRYGSYAGLDARPADGSLPDVTDALRASPDYEADPWYWVPAEETTLRVARVPQRLKAYLRKDNADGCLKVLAEWVLSTLDPDDLLPDALARSATPATARLCEILGDRAVTRGILGATFSTWLGRVAPGARKMARETPLDGDDLRFIKQGPKDVLDLSTALIQRKQPRWLMGWRDICRSTDERTVIASVFPRVGVGHTTPMVFANKPALNIAALVSQLASLPFDYAARQKLAGTHLTYTYINQLPILAPEQFTRDDLAFLNPRVLELTYTSHAMKPWAEDLGHSGAPFAWNPDRRAILRADIDAFFARKYGLSRDELRYVLDPAKTHGTDYPSETFRGLQRNEIDEFGEYRTERLVLAAWDRMEAGDEFTAIGM
ncbi:N-6 DNA methylase, partial [Pseudoruegeria sp. M32A2M]|nr:N-6 DNA methylase [Pseudoruegeria sp. M32A2M]